VTYSEAVRTRYAPTPSGYLHEGNAAHFLVVARLAHERGGDIALRIDDIDAARFRGEYLMDIFDLLEWLELPWSFGPRVTSDLEVWSQSTRLDRYREAFAVLRADHRVYACECSRAEWTGHSGSSCPRDCRARKVHAGNVSFRLHVPTLGAIADPVIWRRDDLPAYHLASVVDDDLWGIDFVVRGADLRDSTATQLALSELLPGSQFRHATVLHHDLALDDQGSKMSKSSGRLAAPLERTDRTRSTIVGLADRLYETLVNYRPRNS
jgi:glutamyl/glutaminyl-tRNA synthetase